MRDFMNEYNEEMKRLEDEVKKKKIFRLLKMLFESELDLDNYFSDKCKNKNTKNKE